MGIQVNGMVIKDTGNGIIATIEYAQRKRTVYGEDKVDFAINIHQYIERYGLLVVPTTAILIIHENGGMASLHSADFYAMLYQWRQGDDE